MQTPLLKSKKESIMLTETLLVKEKFTHIHAYRIHLL